MTPEVQFPRLEKFLAASGVLENGRNFSKDMQTQLMFYPKVLHFILTLLQ